MKISSISFLNYQNSISNTSYDYLKTKKTLSDNKITFEGKENNIPKTIKIAEGKAIGLIGGLGLPLGMFLKTSTEESTIQKNFDKLLLNEDSLIIKKINPQLYSKLFDAYSEDPKFITSLINEKTKNEQNAIDEDSYMHTYNDVIAIHVINKKDPSLTNLAKKVFSGQHSKADNLVTTEREFHFITQTVNAIIEKPDKVDLIMKTLEESGMFDSSQQHRNGFKLETIIKELNKDNSTENTNK